MSNLSPDILKKIQNRQNANNEILEIIKSVIEYSPSLRFGQILCALNIINNEHSDPFYDEPDEILERIKNSSTYKQIFNN